MGAFDSGSALAHVAGQPKWRQPLATQFISFRFCAACVCMCEHKSQISSRPAAALKAAGAQIHQPVVVCLCVGEFVLKARGRDA